MAGRVGPRFHSAHREVALDAITAGEHDLKIVEIGMIGIPQVRRSEWEGDFLIALRGEDAGDRAMIAAVAVNATGEPVRTLRRRRCESGSGSMSSSSMWAVGTGSAHTVCQMPLTAVYQMPPGLTDLFPARIEGSIGGVPDGDHDFLRAGGMRASVTSKVKGS